MTDIFEQTDAQRAAAIQSFDEQIVQNLTLLMELIADLKDELRAEWRKIKAGENTELNLKAKLKGEIPALIMLAIETEGKLNDHVTKRCGKAGSFALDLGRARLEIGSRLARLRAARDSG